MRGATNYDRWLHLIKKRFDDLKLPATSWHAVEQYLKHGTAPGHFLQPLLENNFAIAVMHADDQNLACIKQWSQFLMNGLPVAVWGSRRTVNNWRSMKGWVGRGDAFDEPDMPIG